MAPTAEERQLAERLGFAWWMPPSDLLNSSIGRVYCIRQMWNALLASEREKQELRRVLQLALIPLAALVVSGECVDAPSALTEELKLAILQAHDEALKVLLAEALLGRKP